MENNIKKLCVIVPYRNRESHLKSFLPHMKQTLEAQGIDYSILVVEQTFEKPFNRAKLLNVGYLYTKGVYDYYVMHDVDMLPVTSDYSYSDKPTHMAAEAEQFGWKLPYNEYFGGVTMFSKESFEKLNGYANEYWSWGAEDDDMFRRCVTLGVTMQRRNCRYQSLAHDRNIDPVFYNKNIEKLQAFNESFREGKFIEGLSNCSWKLLEEKIEGKYIHTKVEI